MAGKTVIPRRAIPDNVLEMSTPITYKALYQFTGFTLLLLFENLYL